ncbi:MULTISPECIES: MFS transporter [Alteromonas]|jgi:fucose permease|uniref:MFS transporter n=2 Tax=Alteromonas australica TaxID=589873 RepID=A0A075P3V2_9ALTE|nr:MULTISPECIES: MFS transporter [Alteromonas]MAF69021.1 MFS transporter [Alteromonas sp.]AIG00517.1 MFS transporter [Alteromonas australica]MBU35441.1 MFS transporter [Alteromonas sp.]QPL49960.1 MFS transporter [Alteromonas sp. B31-7]HAI70872.1 MFS transporter [Alteromonas australica]|tara:strand:+ start:117 stop:1289 length:1173 start_codon:yes stop_codon:yes gene_type:complete
MSRRPVTIVIFSGFFLLGMLFILWGILLPDIAKDLRMSELVSGTFFSLFSIGMMLGAVIGGKYVSRFDHMPLLAALLSINALLLFTISQLHQWQWVLVVAVLIGIVSSTIFTLGHTLIARLYEEKRFTMMGLMDFMFSLGTFAASFFVTVLYGIAENWRLPIQVLAAVMVCVSAYTYIAARSQAKVLKGQPKPERKTLAFGAVIKQPIFIFMALLSFGYGAVEFGNANWFVSYAQNGIGFTGEQSRNLLACFTAGMVISRLVFPFLLRFVSVHRLIVFMASASLVGVFAIKLMPSLYGIGAGNLFLGLGLGGLFPLMLSAAMNIDSQNGPVLSGICIIGNSTGVQVASFSTGLWANYVPLTTAFWVIPMGGCVLWLAAFGYSRLVKQHHA